MAWLRAWRRPSQALIGSGYEHAPRRAGNGVGARAVAELRHLLHDRRACRLPLGIGHRVDGLRSRARDTGQCVPEIVEVRIAPVDCDLLYLGLAETRPAD